MSEEASGGRLRGREGERQADLLARLDAVQARINAACQQAGREPGEVRLIVVTKTYPASDVRHLLKVGVRDLGESRDQEARAKIAELALGDIGLVAPTWHFIGRLQTNKAARVASYADLVHSLDRIELLSALGRGAQAVGREVGVLLQVSLDGDPHRGGVLAEDLSALAERAAGEPGVRLRGIMAVAPLEVPAEQAFRGLRRLSDVVRTAQPDADLISAGMSGDLEQAIAAGATHLRVGSAVLGSRQSLQ